MAVRYPGRSAPKQAGSSGEDREGGLFGTAAAEQVARVVQVDVGVRRQLTRGGQRVAREQELVETPPVDVAVLLLAARRRLLARFDVDSAHRSSQVSRDGFLQTFGTDASSVRFRTVIPPLPPPDGDAPRRLPPRVARGRPA